MRLVVASCRTRKSLPSRVVQPRTNRRAVSCGIALPPPAAWWEQEGHLADRNITGRKLLLDLEKGHRPAVSKEEHDEIAVPSSRATTLRRHRPDVTIEQSLRPALSVPRYSASDARTCPPFVGRVRARRLCGNRSAVLRGSVSFRRTREGVARWALSTPPDSRVVECCESRIWPPPGTSFGEMPMISIMPHQFPDRIDADLFHRRLRPEDDARRAASDPIPRAGDRLIEIVVSKPDGRPARRTRQGFARAHRRKAAQDAARGHSARSAA